MLLIMKEQVCKPVAGAKKSGPLDHLYSHKAVFTHLHLILPCASYLDCNAMLIRCDQIEIGCIYTWFSLCSSAISDYRNRMLMQVYRRPCWLTDEDVHGCGQLASTLRVTGREAGTSSRHRPLGNLSERKRVQQKDE